MKKIAKLACLLTFLLIMLCVYGLLGQTALNTATSPKASALARKLSTDEYRVPLLNEGLVPDKDTAIKIAEVVLFRLYGQEDIIHQRPYNVKEEDYIWWIYGTLPEGHFGTVFNIGISKHTGAILHLTR